MPLYSDLRPASGTEQFTSKPPKQVVQECVSGLQSASMSFPGNESVPLSLSYHPFYSTLLGPEKAAEYASKVCSTLHSYQVASALLLGQLVLQSMYVCSHAKLVHLENHFLPIMTCQLGQNWKKQHCREMCHWNNKPELAETTLVRGSTPGSEASKDEVLSCLLCVY